VWSVKISIVNYRTQLRINIKDVICKGTLKYSACSRGGATGDSNVQEYYILS